MYPLFQIAAVYLKTETNLWSSKHPTFFGPHWSTLRSEWDAKKLQFWTAMALKTGDVNTWSYCLWI